MLLLYEIEFIKKYIYTKIMYHKQNIKLDDFRKIEVTIFGEILPHTMSNF